MGGVSSVNGLDLGSSACGVRVIALQRECRLGLCVGIVTTFAQISQPSVRLLLEKRHVQIATRSPVAVGGVLQAGPPA